MSKLKKREKKLLITLGIIAVVGGVILYRIYGPDNSEPVVISESVVEEESATTPTRSYSANSSGGSRGGGSSQGSSSSNEVGGVVQVQEFEKHRKKDDCWIAIKDVVYDISSLVQRYPQQIGSATEYCGTFGFDFGFLEGEDKIQFIIENSQRMGTISY